MRGWINKYATAITAALFLVVAASGVAMFFHIGKDLVSEMHEWLALTLLVPVALHIYKNWPAMVTYFRRRTILAPLALSLVVAGAFIGMATISGGHGPIPRLIGALENARIADVGRLLDVAPEALEGTLKAEGFVVQSTEQRLSEIAQASNKPPMAALMTVLDAGRP